jgi:hypothetical protein
MNPDALQPEIIEAEVVDTTLEPSPAPPQGRGELALAVAPTPRCRVNVRAATADDLPFVDALQKMHGHMVGFLFTSALEKHIKAGRCLIAEELPQSGVGAAIQMGYVIASYEYRKRDEVGIVYQLNVMPLRHRHLVGATLIKSVFDRAPYGCRLFSCWCAQDIQANWFWESIGFVPLAFRTGSRAKQRVHIFWQRRVRDNDDSTPYWFPAKTDGGGVNEDRIVLPIPPGTHWRDAKPVLLPGLPPPLPEVPLTLPGGQPVRARPEQPKMTVAQKMQVVRSESKVLKGTPPGKAAIYTSSGVKYVDRADAEELVEAIPAKPKKPRAPRQKNDPKYEAAARELRDRYLEEVNGGAGRMLPAANGKYDVSRQLAAAPTNLNERPLLEAA